MPHQTFDASYYKRFYSSTPVHSRKKVEELAAGVHALCAWWDVPVTSVLDVGAGIGYWRDWYARVHPRVTRLSVDISEHACERYGHERRDISEWRPRRKFDLVVCHGVLQYLTAAQAENAIENLAAATRHVLYLEVPTTDDMMHSIDAASTDLDVHRRSGAWYRKRLTQHFDQAGSGLWVKRDGDVVLYELERSR
jgi:SAM-dependent methyltransferase